MFERLEQIESKYEELNTGAGLAGDRLRLARYQKTAKAHSELQPIVEKYREYKDLTRGIQESKAMLADESDPEMRAYAQEELTQLEERVGTGRRRAEGAAAAQGSERREERHPGNPRRHRRRRSHAVRGRDLPHVQRATPRSQRWKVEVLSTSESSVGGLKEVIAIIEGQGVYSRMKYESGVHRVQRVPQTETQGRVHTSAVTVAVLPEAEDVDIKIEAKDIRIDTFCSSGPGGQSVNTTYSAVRITHLPTNTVVSCQDEKSQIKNREKGMRVLRARLYEMEQQKQQDALAKERKAMVGSGDRSEKIRTYNFPQNRVTDHRIGFTAHQLPEFMDGRIQPMIDALITHFQSEKLKQESEVLA